MWAEHWVRFNKMDPEGSRGWFRKASKKLGNRRGRPFSLLVKATRYKNLRSQSAAIGPPAHTLKVTMRWNKLKQEELSATQSPGVVSPS